MSSTEWLSGRDDEVTVETGVLSESFVTGGPTSVEYLAISSEVVDVVNEGHSVFICSPM